MVKNIYVNMSAEPLLKEFEKTTEVLPFPKYGLSSFDEFRKIEENIQHTQWLKKVGLANDEIELYYSKEKGLNFSNKIESSVLKSKLKNIYNKIQIYQNKANCRSAQPSTSQSSDDLFEKLQKKPVLFYPEGHPMNDIKELEENLFGHLNSDVIPITKRRKMLRHLERRKERILAQEKQLIPPLDHSSRVGKYGSLWDVKEMPNNNRDQPKSGKRNSVIGPKQQTLYTIKYNKIVRLEPVQSEQISNVNEENCITKEFRAVDIVIPINAAEEQLLEGTKMSIDDIIKIERFKDYLPGVPSKVLYAKNIAPSVTVEQLQLLFNQFQLENGGPIEIRLMSGRMRGQAFISFQTEELAVKVLEEVNGTILSGKPVIIQFGRNSNRINNEKVIIR